jgi:hypothetical protein
MVLVALLAGCSSILGIEEFGGPSPPTTDGDVPPPPAQLTLSGQLDIALDSLMIGPTRPAATASRSSRSAGPSTRCCA